jgi:hypothetical protein
LLGGIIAEQLAQRFLMPGDTVFAHQIDKVPLGVTRQRRFAKMRVLAQIGRGFDIHIGKVAAAAAGHQDLTPGLFAVIQQQHATARLPRLRCTKHSRRSGANYNGIKPFHVKILSIPIVGIVKFPQWSHQQKIPIMYSLKDIGYFQQVKPNRKKIKKSLYFTLPAPPKSLIMRRVHVLKMA